MNRREFARLAALAPLVAAAPELKAAPADKPSILLPESARVYDIGHGEARILAGAEQSGGAWWLASILSDAGRKTSLHVHFSADEHVYVLEGVSFPHGWTIAGRTSRSAPWGSCRDGYLMR